MNSHNPEAPEGESKMRKTKIVCTVGPAVDRDDILRQLMLNGMNVARLNFSHGSHEEHKGRVDRIKQLRQELNLPIALLLDTKGPEIRTGNFESDRIHLTEGDQVTVRAGSEPGNGSLITVTYANIHNDLRRGSRILIDDGLVELEVLDIEGKDIHCRVRNGGPVSNHKSINLPNVHINLPPLTDKDVADIRFAIEIGRAHV